MTTLVAARPVDESVIRELQDEAVAWLKTRGTDQWQNLRPARHGTGRSLLEAITRGEVFIVREGERIVGTVTLDQFADPEFWTPQDDPASALYIHRMVVARQAQGQDIGGRMIDWALARTDAQDKKWLRLDAWRTNPDLHAYYLQHGFQHVRTVELAHRGSGALFQRPVHARDSTTPHHQLSRPSPDIRT